jgi:hypothetical protein
VRQVVKRHPGNCQDRHLVELGVIKAVQQVDAAGTGSSHTDTQSACELRVAASHQGGTFLMADVNQPNPVAASTQCFEDTIDSVTR